MGAADDPLALMTASNDDIKNSLYVIYPTEPCKFSRN